MCVWCLFFVQPLLAPLVDSSVNMRSVKMSWVVNFNHSNTAKFKIISKETLNSVFGYIVGR